MVKLRKGFYMNRCRNLNKDRDTAVRVCGYGRLLVVVKEKHITYCYI